MAFIGVEDLRLRCAREFGPGLERAHTADPQEELLQQAVLSPAAVQAVGDRTESIVVLGDVGVEEKKADTTDGRLPDARVQGAALRQRQGDVHGRAVRLPEHGERQPVRVEHRVALHLPAVRGDRLREVAGAVEQAHPDQRHPEVGCALQVVSGEDAESSRVLRERCGDAELRREVGDRPGGRAVEALIPAWLAQIGVQVVAQPVGPLDVTVVVRELGEAGGMHRSEQRDGIMPCLLPQLGRDAREELSCGFVPGPTQVACELFQRPELFGEYCANGKPSDRLHANSLGESDWMRASPPRAEGCQLAGHRGTVRVWERLRRTRRRVKTPARTLHRPATALRPHRSPRRSAGSPSSRCRPRWTTERGPRRRSAARWCPSARPPSGRATT